MRDSIPGRGKRFFSSAQRLGRLWCWVKGALSLELKQQGREAEHLFPSTAEVKNGGTIPPHPPYGFMEYCLIA
jgi:hypothetical protein